MFFQILQSSWLIGASTNLFGPIWLSYEWRLEVFSAKLISTFLFSIGVISISLKGIVISYISTLVPWLMVFIHTENMKLITLARSICACRVPSEITGPLQFRSFQCDFVPRDPKAKPKRYKYPPFYDPYGPRPLPTDKIVQLAERSIALP